MLQLVIDEKRVGLHCNYNRRWSRGHKARGQGQGHSINPRPRTAFPRTDLLEAKERNARSQDQGNKKIPRLRPRTVFQGQTLSNPGTGLLEAKTKDTAGSVLQKKGLQKSFSGNLQFIGVPWIFDWGRPKPQITCYDVIKNFQKRKFLWDKIFDIIESQLIKRNCLILLLLAI